VGLEELRSLMPRWLTRLVAVVSLLAFLAGNGSAITHARSSFSHHTCGEGGCENCLTEEHAHSTPSVVEVGGSTTPSHDELPGPSCPCPGGCAFCSVAKVPGLSPLVAPAIVTRCLDDCLDEMPCVYVPPFCGQLIRPPRS